MVGNNELHINQATMIEAVQMYLNAQMTNAQRVVSVAKNNDGGFSGVDEFVVKLTDAETK